MLKNIVEKYAIIIYLGITFALSWPIAIYLARTSTQSAEALPVNMVIGGIILGLAPSFTGIILSRILHIPMKKRIQKKSPMHVYILVALFIPVTAMLADGITNIGITNWAFRVSMPPLIIGLIWPIFSSCGEEFGWRGFLLPQLLKKYSVATSATIVGCIWGFWHIPMFWVSYKFLASTGIVMTFMQALNLLVLSYLMAAIQVWSKGNMKLSVLFHYTITAMGILPGGYMYWPNADEFTNLNSLIVLLLIRIIIILIIFMVKDREINKPFDRMEIY